MSEKDLTEPTSQAIIDSWNRAKYASFQDYLSSEDYEKWREDYEIQAGR